MRLRPDEILSIKNTVEEILPGAKVYLFGSRVDDSKKGGDIDLLIVTNEKVDFKKQSKIDWILQQKLGEQKIDILYQIENEMTNFGWLALETGIKL
ncbi:nucleotidyltransferase domain-containing protein [bacterium]|nr:nucleotidyltransferase domain-containing protein [bacterium]